MSSSEDKAAWLSRIEGALRVLKQQQAYGGVLDVSGPVLTSGERPRTMLTPPLR